MIELNGIQLDKTSAVPLYEQLRKALLEAITSGKLSAGTKLPTEEELCAQFGISRPVARQAYNMLIEEGFVERMRGRGTFVRSPDTRGRFLNKQLSFAAEMGVLNLEHRTEVLRAEWVSYTPELFSRLKLERGDRCYHLVRMRYVSGKPFVLVENYVPRAIQIYKFRLAIVLSSGSCSLSPIVKNKTALAQNFSCARADKTNLWCHLACRAYYTITATL